MLKLLTVLLELLVDGGQSLATKTSPWRQQVWKGEPKPFISHGIIKENAHGSYLTVPVCPRCTKQHFYGPAYTKIDSYGRFFTRRAPHCEGKYADIEKVNDIEFKRETIITGRDRNQSNWSDDEIEWKDGDLAIHLTTKEFGDKWLGAPFIHIWENDPEYCYWIVTQPEVKVSNKKSLSTKQEHFNKLREWTMMVTTNVYKSKLGDNAGNMVGSSGLRTSRIHTYNKARYKSFLNQWESVSKHFVPDKCCNRFCLNRPTVGAHVHLQRFPGGVFLVPMCHRCNTKGKEHQHNPEQAGNESHPINLRPGTYCVKWSHDDWCNGTLPCMGISAFGLWPAITLAAASKVRCFR